MRIKPATYLLITVLLSACSSVIEPPFGTIDWYLSNGTGNNLTMSVYDNVCKKTLFRVDLPRGREIPLTTCATENGRADVRYRRREYRASEDNPWLDARVSANQVLVVRY